jgi:hypothetical protein
MRALALLLAVVLLVGCSIVGDGDSGVLGKPGVLQKLVLQPEDLPQVFLRFDEGQQGIADMPAGQRGDATRFGRNGGWKARYRRSGTTKTEGPLVIASLVDLFESSDGAKEDLEAVRSELEDGELPWKSADSPELGDESVAGSFEQGSGATRVAYFRITWRRENVTATLEVNGFHDRVELADAVELARKQANRIDQAAKS